MVCYLKCVSRFKEKKMHITTAIPACFTLLWSAIITQSWYNARSFLWKGSRKVLKMKCWKIMPKFALRATFSSQRQFGRWSSYGLLRWPSHRFQFTSFYFFFFLLMMFNTEQCFMFIRSLPPSAWPTILVKLICKMGMKKNVTTYFRQAPARSLEWTFE